MADLYSAYQYLRKKARETHSLLSIHLDITYRCPLKCMHCYIDHRNKDELSIKEIEKLLIDACKLNALFVTYSGGEVFARDDFDEILSITYKHKFSIKIITSGYLIGEREAKVLKKYNVISVGVSLYSLNPVTHDRITGIKGSFERTMNAIKFLKEYGLSIVIKTSIMRDNYKDYPELLKWVKRQGKNVFAQYDMVITPTMEQRRGVRELNIPYEEKKRLYNKIKDIEDKREVKFEELEDTERIRVGKESVTCYAGITGLYISPDGKVYPCVEWNELLGDLRRESLIDIWNNSEKLKLIQNLRVKDYKKCILCKYLSICSICPGLNLRDRKEIFKPSPLACQRARMYYE